MTCYCLLNWFLVRIWIEWNWGWFIETSHSSNEIVKSISLIILIILLIVRLLILPRTFLPSRIDLTRVLRLCGSPLSKWEIISHKIMWLDNNINNGLCFIPILSLTQFVIENKWFRVCRRLQWFVEWRNLILAVSVYNSDIWSLTWECVWYHHIIINFTNFSPNFNFHDSFYFNVSLLLTMLNKLEDLCLEVWINMKNLFNCFFDDEFNIIGVCTVVKLTSQLLLFIRIVEILHPSIHGCF